jgi:hypothetical protein
MLKCRVGLKRISYWRLLMLDVSAVCGSNGLVVNMALAYRRLEAASGGRSLCLSRPRHRPCRLR